MKVSVVSLNVFGVNCLYKIFLTLDFKDPVSYKTPGSIV